MLLFQYMHDIVEHEINLTVLLSYKWKTGDYSQDYQRHKSEHKWTNGWLFLKVYISKDSVKENKQQLIYQSTRSGSTHHGSYLDLFSCWYSSDISPCWMLQRLYVQMLASSFNKDVQFILKECWMVVAIFRRYESPKMKSSV